MNKEQIKQYYERIEKLLNGANKETYGFVPEEIRQILRSYEILQQENKQLKENWNKLKEYLDNKIDEYSLHLEYLSVERMSYVKDKMKKLEKSDSNGQ